MRQLDNDIPQLADHEVIVRLTQITALVGDGHTGTHLPDSFRFYPLGLYWFGNELRVTGATKDYARALGTRVVAIGGVPIEQVNARVKTCLPSAQNENEWYVMSATPSFMMRPEVLHALRVVREVERAEFTLQDDQGKEPS